MYLAAFIANGVKQRFGVCPGFLTVNVDSSAVPVASVRYDPSVQGSRYSCFILYQRMVLYNC